MTSTGSSLRKNAGTTRGKPFQVGNPGRPAGSRNKTTLAIEALLDGEANAITRKAIELAKLGDGPAMRLCMDRLAAPRKDRPVRFPLPPLKTADDAVRATAAITAAVGAGELTPGEAGELAKVIDAFSTALFARDLERRLAKLKGQSEMNLRQIEARIAKLEQAVWGGFFVTAGPDTEAGLMTGRAMLESQLGRPVADADTLIYVRRFGDYGLRKPK